MNKLFIALSFFCLALPRGYSQSLQRGISYRTAATTISTGTFSGTSYADYTAYKRRSKMFLLAGAVLCGAGTLAFAYTAVISQGETRDPVLFEEHQRDVRTGLITGGSLLAASIPLFAIGTIYHYKYRNTFAFQLHIEPGYDYKGNTASSLHVGLGLHL